ncbi:MAG: ATP-grasp domain-containing protein [Actinomycetota bacterium]|nr:ATP-grasp domain-containing protein [Actinomycetota bacterium]
MARSSQAVQHADDVLVIDAEQRAALAAVRVLGAGGLRTVALATSPLAPALFSRWTGCRATVTDPDDDPDGFVDGVLEVCTERRPRVLIACHDGSIAALRRRRREVEQVVGLALAREPAIEIAVDKSRTLAIAAELGIRVPRGVLVEKLEEAAAAVTEVGLPVVCKPVQSWAFGADGGQRLHATVASQKPTALAAVRGTLEQGVSVLVQEWLSGDREAVSLMLTGDRIWARFAQRATRTMPPLGGNSVLRESIPLPEDITPDAERLVRAIGLEGYAEVEFRRDRSGRPALMEINPRLSASVENAVRAGIPFPRLVYDWAAGTALQDAGEYGTGLRMRWLGGDVRWLRRCVIDQGAPDVPSRARALGVFFGDFARPASYDYMTGNDLVPAAAAILGMARRPSARRPAATHGHDTDVAVIGAGPYGLSIAAHLRAAGVAHAVLGQTMDSWQNHMPRGMYLKSEGFASNLSDPERVHSLERFCAETGREYGPIAVPISLETFTAYGQWFAERAAPGVRPDLVRHVMRCAGGFELTLDSGDGLRTRRIVVATGTRSFAFVPSELRGLPPGTVAHSYEQADVWDQVDYDLLVVGAGQSALEAAALARENGARVTLLARTTRLAWNSKPGGQDRPLRSQLRNPQSGLGEGAPQRLFANHPLTFHHAPERLRRRYAYRFLGPAGAWWLRPRFEGQVPTMLGRSLVAAHAENAGVRVLVRSERGVEEVRVGKILTATGYRPDVMRLAFLDASIRAKLAAVAGAPVLDRDFRSSVPDLYFVGYPAALSFGPLMRFVFGAEFVARRITHGLRET